MIRNDANYIAQLKYELKRMTENRNEWKKEAERFKTKYFDAMQRIQKMEEERDES